MIPDTEIPLKHQKKCPNLNGESLMTDVMGNVYVCRWKDSSVATIASNYDTHDPMNNAKSFCRQEKRKWMFHSHML